MPADNTARTAMSNPRLEDSGDPASAYNAIGKAMSTPGKKGATAMQMTVAPIDQPISRLSSVRNSTARVVRIQAT